MEKSKIQMLLDFADSLALNTLLRKLWPTGIYLNYYYNSIRNGNSQERSDKTEEDMETSHHNPQNYLRPDW